VYVVECVPTNIVFKMLMITSIIVMQVYDFGLHMAKSMHSWMFGLILVMLITHQSNDIIV
jgi:accessory gene regulator protein AgrB